MKLPRVRFTVRRMMAGIAVVACMLNWFWIKGRRDVYTRHLVDCLRWERFLHEKVAFCKRKWEDERDLAAFAKVRGLHDSASDWERVAEEYHAELLTVANELKHARVVRRAWERVCSHPWESPPPVRPPMGVFEVDVRPTDVNRVALDLLK